MRWVAKAALQNVFAATPRGDELNHLFQRHVTRSLPTDEEAFDHHVDSAVMHVRAIQRWAPKVSLTKARLFEFGAGADLGVPLLFWRMGVDHQLLVDIVPKLKLDLVDDMVRRVAALDEQRCGGLPLRALDTTPVRSEQELRDRLGIDYRAPADARATGLPAGSIDVVTSTFTLEHIPADDIAAILRECHRLLDGDGVLTARIDMQDHYSFFDPSITAHNFLRFSERAWRLVNSEQHFQNRLRAPDYLRLFEAADLRVLDKALDRASPAEEAWLEETRLAPRFAGHHGDDLSARRMSVVASARRP